MSVLEKSIVVLHRDFGKEWVEPLIRCGYKSVGLHVNPFEASVDEFLNAIDAMRDTIDALEDAGVRVEYYLHGIGYLLPRDLFAASPSLFRMGEDGRRTAAYNCCVCNERALAVIAENAALLAARLRQRSHRYHIWQDDDLGGDVTCKCEKCRALPPFAQVLRLAQAVLRGLQAYDPQAEVSALVYGEQEADVSLPDGVFLEFAPFRREHGCAITSGERNGVFRRRLEKLMQTLPTRKIEVLEYFLSYDYADFCRDDGRVKEDLAYYRALGVERLATFAVFPQTDYVKTHGFDGIYQYTKL